MSSARRILLLMRDARSVTLHTPALWRYSHESNAQGFGGASEYRWSEAVQGLDHGDYLVIGRSIPVHSTGRCDRSCDGVEV